MKIKAFAIKERNGNAESFYYDKEIQSHDVLVKVTYCSITTGDINFIADYWQDTKFPLVAGHEIIGIVEQIGEDVKNLKVGDLVGIGYQQSACFNCEFCNNHQEQFCLNQKVIGVHSFGGLAKHIITDSRFAFKIPAGMDLIKTAPLLCSGLTVYSAILKANLKPKSNTAVLGIGGLGHLAIQFLKKMNHKVTALSHSQNKQPTIEKLGADFNNTTQKFDLIISTLNTNYDLNTYLKYLKPDGKFCILGLPNQKLCFSPELLADYSQKTIYGSYIGSRKEMIAMLNFANKSNIKAIVETLPFSKINEAINKVRKKEIPYRLVLVKED